MLSEPPPCFRRSKISALVPARKFIAAAAVAPAMGAGQKKRTSRYPTAPGSTSTRRKPKLSFVWEAYIAFSQVESADDTFSPRRTMT